MIDYEEKIRSGRIIQKLFVEPNNNLPIYKKAINRGVISFSDSLEHNILISVADAYDNRSDLIFRVHSSGIQDPVSFPSQKIQIL